MDKFPKMETIEATFFGQRVDSGPNDGVTELAEELSEKCQEFVRYTAASCFTVEYMTRLGKLAGEIGMSIVLARMFKAGVTAERARAECEQLQDAMNPQQLTEGRHKPCKSGSCESIT